VSAMPSARISLEDAIAAFDRKERRAVVRLCGGEEAVHVDARLSELLTKQLQLREPPINKRWYLDYHWNWIVGALMLFQNKLGTAINDSDLRKTVDNSVQEFVENNQEDVDALIVSDNNIILIEAKWDGTWDAHRDQIYSKLGRYSALQRYFGDFCNAHGIKFHWVIAHRGHKGQVPERVLAEFKKINITPAQISFADDLGEQARRRARVSNITKDSFSIDLAPGWGDGVWPWCEGHSGQ